nr:hypothetical protein CFP56_60769 [Quercus suber]
MDTDQAVSKPIRAAHGYSQNRTRRTGGAASNRGCGSRTVLSCRPRLIHGAERFAGLSLAAVDALAGQDSASISCNARDAWSCRSKKIQAMLHFAVPGLIMKSISKPAIRPQS